MRRVTCCQGKLQIDLGQGVALGKANGFETGEGVWDRLLPGGGFARGSLHELLMVGEGRPLFVAGVIARLAGEKEKSSGEENPQRGGKRGCSVRALVWCEREARLYPPALAGMGIELERMVLVRPGNEVDEVWALAEALRCPGVGVTVGSPRRLTPIQARRLQLAAEMGGGVGILMRPAGRVSAAHSAATRWLVRAVPGERTLQRWEMQLVHGHGGRVGQSVILEVSRETNLVRVFESVVDRSVGEEGRRRRA